LADKLPVLHSKIIQNRSSSLTGLTKIFLEVSLFMEQKLEQLKMILAEIADLQGAASVLGWDQQVNMPVGGAKARGQQLGTLRSLAHQKFTSPEVAGLLESLEAHAGTLDPDSDDARLIKVTRRRFEKSVRVPRDYIFEGDQQRSSRLASCQEGKSLHSLPAFPGKDPWAAQAICRFFCPIRPRI
jgi:hypothetical protein